MCISFGCVSTQMSNLIAKNNLPNMLKIIWKSGKLRVWPSFGGFFFNISLTNVALKFKIWMLTQPNLCKFLSQLGISTQMMSDKIPPWQLASVLKGPKWIPVKLGQNQVSYSWDIADMDNKCHQDKCRVLYCYGWMGTGLLEVLWLEACKWLI